MFNEHHTLVAKWWIVLLEMISYIITNFNLKLKESVLLGLKGVLIAEIEPVLLVEICNRYYLL